MPSTGVDLSDALDEQNAAVARHPIGQGSPESSELVTEHPHGWDRWSRHRHSLTQWGSDQSAGMRGSGRRLSGFVQAFRSRR